MTLQRPSMRRDEPPTVLLIEPEAVCQKMLLSGLSGSGLRCLAAPAPDQAVALAAQRQVSAVLINADAVKVGQWEPLLASRRGNPGNYVPMLAYSRSWDSAERAGALSAGADDVMTLDGGSEELVARLQGLLARKQIRDELEVCRIQFRDSMARQQRFVQRVRRQNRRLREMALTDPLTGVHNSRYFREWLTTQFEIARRYKLVISLLMIDIDKFKTINDTCGHPFGDYVLSQFASILTHQVRSSDVVARLGGDEFAIGLVETSRQEAVRFGRRLLRSVASSSFEYFGQSKSITISVGQAGFPDDPEVASAEQLMLFADQALYRAKARGRNDLACWHELEPQIRMRLAGPPGKTRPMTVSAEPTLCLVDPE